MTMGLPKERPKCNGHRCPFNRRTRRTHEERNATNPAIEETNAKKEELQPLSPPLPELPQPTLRKPSPLLPQKRSL